MSKRIKIFYLSFTLVATQVLAELPGEEAILKAGGVDAQTIVHKARTILLTQRVFASRAVGYGGQPTSGCWALTVIVRHDKEAREIFNEIYQFANQPAAKLYAIAGLLIVDPQRKKDFSPGGLGKAAEREVERFDECSGSSSTIGAIVSELMEHGANRYVYEKLPSLYQTTDCARTQDAKR